MVGSLVNLNTFFRLICSFCVNRLNLEHNKTISFDSLYTILKQNKVHFFYGCIMQICEILILLYLIPFSV